MQPDIHTWWPELSIDAKHGLRERPEEPIDADVRAEIEHITGVPIPDGTRLDSADVEFIRTQREQVD